jgi:hypothetical protein
VRVALKPRVVLRPGAYRLRVTGRDAAGDAVRVTLRLRLR